MKKMHLRIVKKYYELDYAYFNVEIKGGVFGWGLYTTKEFEQEVDAIAYIGREVSAHRELNKEPTVVFEQTYDLTK